MGGGGHVIIKKSKASKPAKATKTASVKKPSGKSSKKS